jgi:hypothetical protein
VVVTLIVGTSKQAPLMAGH